tara:strand:- start:1225 stop:1758 length:534 start_codon:yes stop_codon:yes gene_type:complete
MKNIGLFFGSDTGCTESVVAQVVEMIGEDFVDVYEISQVSDPDVFLQYDNILIGIPTWYDGDLQSDWEDFFPKFEKIVFDGRFIAIFGLGDQVGYGEYFVDGIGVLARSAMDNGAQIIGLCPIDGYEYEESQALITIDGQEYFLGLPIDEDNQPHQTEERLSIWLEQVITDFALVTN